MESHLIIQNSGLTLSWSPHCQKELFPAVRSYKNGNSWWLILICQKQNSFFFLNIKICSKGDSRVSNTLVIPSLLSCQSHTVTQSPVRHLEPSSLVHSHCDSWNKPENHHHFDTKEVRLKGTVTHRSFPTGQLLVPTEFTTCGRCGHHFPGEGHQLRCGQLRGFLRVSNEKPERSIHPVLLNHWWVFWPLAPSHRICLVSGGTRFWDVLTGIPLPTPIAQSVSLRRHSLSRRLILTLSLPHWFCDYLVFRLWQAMAERMPLLQKSAASSTDQTAYSLKGRRGPPLGTIKSSDSWLPSKRFCDKRNHCSVF